MIPKVQWAAARVVFLVMAFAATASGGLMVFLLGPLYSWYFFNDIHFLNYRRLLFPVVAAYWKLVFELVRNPAYRQMFGIPLTAPPMKGPDYALVRVKKTWSTKDGACNGCVQCCVRRSCPMLDLERKLCLSYGSFFWRYFNCGRYPENEEQIHYYDCPKWEIRNE